MEPLGRRVLSPALARHSGLGIQHCHSYSFGHDGGSDVICGLGTPDAVGQPKITKKKKKACNINNPVFCFVLWSGLYCPFDCPKVSKMLSYIFPQKVLQFCFSLPHIQSGIDFYILSMI